MTGEIAYFWIPTGDLERAETFYGDLLGWRFGPGNMPLGRQITNTSPPGGLHGGEDPSGPQVCFAVDDIDVAVARVRELGGQAEDPERIPSGAFAACRDDQGSPLFVWSGTA